jgi:CrcB protein
VAAAGARITLAVAAGSALGALARVGAARVAMDLFGPAFPWGTLAANVAGSFLIGLYAALGASGERRGYSPAMQAFVMAGFCGGFTTFSIFSLEVLHFLQAGRHAAAAIYAGASVLLWLTAVWAGHRSGQALSRRRS